MIAAKRTQPDVLATTRPGQRLPICRLQVAAQAWPAWVDTREELRG